MGPLAFMNGACEKHANLNPISIEEQIIFNRNRKRKATDTHVYETEWKHSHTCKKITPTQEITCYYGNTFPITCEKCHMGKNNEERAVKRPRLRTSWRQYQPRPRKRKRAYSPDEDDRCVPPDKRHRRNSDLPNLSDNFMLLEDHDS